MQGFTVGEINEQILLRSESKKEKAKFHGDRNGRLTLHLNL